MSAQIHLRTDEQSLRTGTCITASQRSSKFGASAAQKRDSVGFFFIVTIPARPQQQTTADFLDESEMQLLPQPPYSPDLSPCDFFFFQK